MKKYLLIVWGLLMSVNLVWAQGSPLTLKEVVGYAYSPQYIYGVRSMNDGEHFTIIKGKQIADKIVKSKAALNTIYTELVTEQNLFRTLVGC